MNFLLVIDKKWYNANDGYFDFANLEEDKKSNYWMLILLYHHGNNYSSEG